MTAKVLFLGPLADIAGAPEMTVETPCDWSGLLALLNAELAAEVQGDRVNVACAGKVLSHKADLLAQAGDEIALLPPVSGG